LNSLPTIPASTGRPTLAASTAVTFIANIFGAALSLASVLVVSRYLGPEGRGQVVFLMTMAALTARFALVGMPEANVNFASAEPEARRSLATNSLLLSLLVGWAGASIVILLTHLVPGIAGPSDGTLRLIALGTVPILVFQQSALRLLHADYRFGAANLATFVQPTVNIVGNGALALAGRLSVETSLLTWICGWIASGLLIAGYYQLRLAGFGRLDRRLAQRTIVFGLKSHLARLMNEGNYRLDQWFVGSLSGARELGLYSIAVSWFEALTYFPTAIATVLRPDLVRATPADAAKRTAAAFRISMIATAIFVIVMVVAAPILTVTMFGDEFRGSILELRVLALGAFGIVAIRLFGSTLIAQSKPLLETIAVGLGLVVTIGLDIALIPRWNGTGAAAASVVSYSAMGIAVIVIAAKTLGGRWVDLRPRLGDAGRMWREIRSLRNRQPVDPLDDQPPSPGMPGLP
jgi:O-antigen/teichoic acid export membrane protein